MREISKAGLAKHESPNGLFWRGRLIWREDKNDKWHYMSRILTRENGERIRAYPDNNDGYKTAEASLERWRDSLIAADKKAEAEARKQKRLKHREAATPSAAKDPLSKYIGDYIARETKQDPEQKNGISIGTADNYRFLMRHITDYFPEDYTVRDLNVENVQAWYDSMKDNGISISSQIKAINLLNRVCLYALKHEHIKQNPVGVIEKPDPVKPDPNPLDEDELKRLNGILDERGNDTFTDIVRLALLTGMRQGELCGLTWRNVDGYKNGNFLDEYVHVRAVIARSTSRGTFPRKCTKTHTKRDIPINNDIAAVLKRRWTTMRGACLSVGVPFDPDMYVFGEIDGGYYSPDYLGKQWRLFADTYHLIGDEGRRIVFHDLRHSFATHAIYSGMNIKSVSEILGHQSSKMTLDVYAKWLRKKLNEEMRMLDGVMSASTTHEVINFKPTGTDSE